MYPSDAVVGLSLYLANMPETRKEIVNPLTSAEVKERQVNFQRRFTAKFFAKHRKYKGILREYGINIQPGQSDYSICFDKTFEEEIEMVVSESREDFAKSCRKSGHYSIRGLFRQIVHAVRRTKASRIMYKLQGISETDMRETLEAVSTEVSIGYEYQIAMLSDENDIYKMADYAVLCVFTYLKSAESSFETSNILQAVLESVPKHKSEGETVIKTKIVKTDSLKRKHSQKWRIQEIFKQPGLRVKKDGSEGPYAYFGCFTPFGCLCRPNKYGYRAPLHVWDDDLRDYRMLDNDRISCHSSHGKQIQDNKEDIHQQYKPETCCCHVTRKLDNQNNCSTNRSEQPKLVNGQTICDVECNVEPTNTESQLTCSTTQNTSNDVSVLGDIQLNM
ncbi:uncharacterized protein LOC117315565 [Pecten maximus]|uniref:uncharacterized protein LOC117315565 n=1 Tax=Pecten maximus TaxID=6579 RepID=UPI0014589E94|nr:uncharacterized protein LOC117315565 [Pecten maximus]XP_033725697.1 uncharacterized protein LOC117315565 [Pecten maximus]XP_033725698.1 uncharacterized protein LOC117315565 [Pecten maximus]XP_033725699.1 uncharacterized protein LOC117315565 [Pecten maximus]